jgi:5-methylcytosine-specific restriction endonuclease McrA
MDVKRCTACGSEKPLSEFYFRTAKGRRYPQSQCKACSKARLRAHGHEADARRRAERKAMGESLRRRDASWPPDDELVRLMAEERTFKGVAGRCGQSREALRDFLTRRPQLEARMREHLVEPMTPEQRQEADRRSKREYGRRRFLADETAETFANILRSDPCAYCGGTTEHVDHIDSRATGGSLEWSNLTAACSSCNRRKHKRPLLIFLAQRGGDRSGQPVLA